MTKKIKVMLAALMCVLMFAACSSSPASSTSSESSTSSTESKDGSVLYLTGTASGVSATGFELTLEDGTKVNVAIDDQTDMTALSADLADGALVSVGAIRVDDKNVTAITVSDDQSLTGGVLFLTGTVKNGATNGFDLVMEDGETVHVVLHDEVDTTGLANGIVEGASIAVGAVYVEENNVTTVTAYTLSDN